LSYSTFLSVYLVFESDCNGEDTSSVIEESLWYQTKMKQQSSKKKSCSRRKQPPNNNNNNNNNIHRNATLSQQFHSITANARNNSAIDAPTPTPIDRNNFVRRSSRPRQSTVLPLSQSSTTSSTTLASSTTSDVLESSNMNTLAAFATAALPSTVDKKTVGSFIFIIVLLKI